MIVCRKCSRRHPDGTTFCTCGAFLEFDGEHVAEAPSPADPVSADHQTGSLPPATAETPTGTWTPDPAAQRHAPQDEPAPWSGFDTDAGSRPATDGVDARLPDTPSSAPATEPVRVESGSRPSDVACRQCGTPNPTEREFCRHCGQQLGLASAATATTTDRGQLPWWRRLGRGARRRAKSIDPTSASVAARQLSHGGIAGRPLAFRATGITVVLMGLLAFLGPWRGTVIAKTKDLVGASRYHVLDEVEAQGVATSASITPLNYELQPAALAIDEFANTAWATRWMEPARLGASALPADGECADEAGTDSSLLFTFAEPTDISRIQILGGRHAADPARQSFSRPRIIELQVGDTCSHLELPDGGELVVHDFDHDDVATVEVRILSRYAEEESAPTVEVSAVAFERKR